MYVYCTPLPEKIDIQPKLNKSTQRPIIPTEQPSTHSREALAIPEHHPVVSYSKIVAEFHTIIDAFQCFTCSQSWSQLLRREHRLFLHSPSSRRDCHRSHQAIPKGFVSLYTHIAIEKCLRRNSLPSRIPYIPDPQMEASS